MGTAVLSGRVRVPDEDAAGELFETASQKLRAAGYRHYEVSNYARPGHESKHNRLYWTGAPHWGLGAGAVGTWDRVRRENTRDTAGYLARIEGGLSAVEAEYSVAGDSDLERVMMGLRLEEGLAWAGLDTDWQEAAHAGVQQGWLAGDENGFRLTPERRALADEAARKLWSAVEAARGAGRSAER
jgi:oxygen-independent coproporphyrinogen-3 oxidase